MTIPSPSPFPTASSGSSLLAREQLLAHDVRPILPALLPEKFLHWRRHEEAVLYVLHRVNLFTWLMGQDSAPLNARGLCGVLGKGYGHDLLHECVREDFLTTDFQFIPEVKSRHFALTDYTRSFPFRRVEASEWLTRKIRQQRDKNTLQLLRDSPVLEQLYLDLGRFYLAGDFQGTLAALVAANPSSAPFLQLQLERFLHRQWHFSRPSGARVFHNITHLSRQLRRHLMVDGEKCSEADVCACQPTLLAHYYAAPCPERTKLIEAIHADFYQFLLGAVAELSGKVLTRGQVKHQFLVEMFGPDYQRKTVWAAMGREFPQLCAKIEEFRKPHYTCLAGRLQRLEASIVIDQVLPRIKQELGPVPLTTVHDCVVGPDDKIEAIAAILSRGFEEHLDFAPKLKIERAA